MSKLFIVVFGFLMAGAAIHALSPVPPKPDPQLCGMADMPAASAPAYREVLCTTDPDEQKQLRAALR